jgi:hypothetical protein
LFSGSSDLPRFSCADHKLGTVIHHALVNQKALLDILKELSRSNSEIRNCIRINGIFQDLKCRPCIYQKTRWLGAIDLLFSNKRAYDKKAFDGEIHCPIHLDVIESYIQILLPAQEFTLNMERNNSSIADVIPGVLYIVNAWDKMQLFDREAKELCYFLIHFTREKFKYELESHQVI